MVKRWGKILVPERDEEGRIDCLMEDQMRGQWDGLYKKLAVSFLFKLHAGHWIS